MKLYELHTELDALDKYLEWYAEAHEGEIPEDGMIKLDALTLEYKDKLENIGRLIKHTEAYARALEDEIQALEKRQEQAEKKAAWFKHYVAANLNGSKFESPTVCYSFRKSSAVEIPDPELVPDEYRRMKIINEPDKQAIRDAISAGKELPFARLIERLNLQVR